MPVKALVVTSHPSATFSCSRAFDVDGATLMTANHRRAPSLSIHTRDSLFSNSFCPVAFSPAAAFSTTASIRRFVVEIPCSPLLVSSCPCPLREPSPAPLSSSYIPRPSSPSSVPAYRRRPRIRTLCLLTDCFFSLLAFLLVPARVYLHHNLPFFTILPAPQTPDSLRQSSTFGGASIS